MVQISYDEDISDAEKVYQECQQSGPLSFSDCLPPARMKHCNKIGEGTFGEVFSTINESNETVALKVCAQFNHIYGFIVESYQLLSDIHYIANSFGSPPSIKRFDYFSTLVIWTGNSWTGPFSILT